MLKKWLFLLIPGLVLAGITLVRLQFPQYIEHFQLQVFDAYQRLKPRQYVTTPVRIVDIDDASLESIGQWPWPRTRIAELIDRINEAGALVVAMDLIFAEPDRTSPTQVLPLWTKSDALRNVAALLPDHDQVLADTIRGKPVVAAMALNHGESARLPQLKAAIRSDAPSALAALPRFSGAVVNLEEIQNAANGIGSVNVVPDPDNIVRRLHTLFRVNDSVYPSLAVESIRTAQAAMDYEVITTAGRLQGVRVGAITVPTDEGGRVWLHYTEPQPQRYLSARHVLSGDFASDKLAGHIVLIGTSAIGLADFRATPMNPVTPGVEVHTTLVEQILLGKFLQRPDWAKGAEIIYLIVLGVVLIMLLRRLNVVSCAVLGGVAVIAAFAVSWYAFVTHAVLIDPLVPSVEALLIYLTGSLINFLQSEAQRRQVRDAFNHFLAPEVVDQLLTEPDRLTLGGETREMTFLFTDIEGFTSFTVDATPETVVRLLNQYLEETCDIVLQHGGTIDKIVGDALHVMFNAPGRQDDHAARAVRCALALDRACQRFVAERTGGKDPCFGQTRIGINTGPVVVGNFGGTKRFDYTAHGDAINTTARLEAANKKLGTRICVSDSTRVQCNDADVTFRPIGNIGLKGKEVPLMVYEPVAADRADEERDNAYAALFEAMSRGEDVCSKMDRLASNHPHDGLIAMHASRLAAGANGTTWRLD